jgi:hypothetical protein
VIQLRKRWHDLGLHGLPSPRARGRSHGRRFGPRLRSTLLVFAIGAPLLAGGVGCREAVRGLGPNAAAVQANADQLFGAMVMRYTQPVRDAKYEEARNRLNRNALVPSNIFDDSTIWTGMPSPVLRAMFVQGGMEGGRYQFVSRPTVTRPSRLGDSRHLVTLARLSPNEFVWDTSVDFALGTVTADEIGAFTAALLGSAEHGTEAELRADYGAAAPRTAPVLGMLFSIDSIRTTAFSDGTAAVSLTIAVHADPLKRRFPAFGDYLAKYANPARYRALLTDRSGAAWFDVQGADRTMSIHYRTARGRLAPLYGPPRARPDTMELRVDFTTKMKLFTIGVENLVMQFVVTNTPHERAWTLTGRREPDWRLPLVTEHLIRSPLRRPFAGEGVIFHIGVRENPEAQTLLERRAHLTVQESAILRFLNSIGSRAMSDLADRTEREEEQFLHDVFAALLADAHGVAPSFGGPVASPETEKRNAADP